MYQRWRNVPVIPQTLSGEALVAEAMVFCEYIRSGSKRKGGPCGRVEEIINAAQYRAIAVQPKLLSTVEVSSIATDAPPTGAGVGGKIMVPKLTTSERNVRVEMCQSETECDVIVS